MRKLSLFLAILMILSAFVACSGETAVTANVPAKDLLSAALECYSADMTKDPGIFYSDAEEGSTNALDYGTMGFYFYGEYDYEISQLQYVEEYALAMPSGLYAFEIDIMKAKTAQDVSHVKELLQARFDVREAMRDEMIAYEPDQVSVLDSGEILVMGQYVILIAAGDNAPAKTAITALLGADAAETEDIADTTAEIIREVIDDEIVHISSSVNSALVDGIHNMVSSSDPTLEKSALPTMTVSTHGGDDLVIFGGKCTVGAKIHVRGHLHEDQVFGTDDDNWFVEVQIPAGVSTLTITQEEPGKAESDPIVVTTQPNYALDFERYGAYRSALGDNMQGHYYGQFDDWMGTNILTEKQVDGLTSRLKTRVEFLAENDCELVYLIVPNPIAIYPETAPIRYPKSTEDTSRTEQFYAAAEAAGATVFKLEELMWEHREDEFKIYNKLDSHWTSYGAYIAYDALMDHISPDWPQLDPVVPGEDVEFYNEVVNGGDIVTAYDLPSELIQENATFVKWLVETVDSPYTYYEGTNRPYYPPITDQKTVKNKLAGDKDLPTAMVIRDSFSTHMYPFFNQSFGKVYWQTLWDYNFDEKWIKQCKPDYYIVLITERNIDSIS